MCVCMCVCVYVCRQGTCTLWHVCVTVSEEKGGRSHHLLGRSSTSGEHGRTNELASGEQTDGGWLLERPLLSSISVRSVSRRSFQRAGA